MKSNMMSGRISIERNPLSAWGLRENSARNLGNIAKVWVGGALNPEFKPKELAMLHILDSCYQFRE